MIRCVSILTASPKHQRQKFMEWDDIYQELCDEMERNSTAAKALQENNPDDYRKILEHLYSIELRERETIDKACAQYASNKSWPINLTQEQALLSYIRIGQA